MKLILHLSSKCNFISVNQPNFQPLIDQNDPLCFGKLKCPVFLHLATRALLLKHLTPSSCLFA